MTNPANLMWIAGQRMMDETIVDLRPRRDDVLRAIVTLPEDRTEEQQHLLDRSAALSLQMMMAQEKELGEFAEGED